MARRLEQQPESTRNAWDWASLAEAYLTARRVQKATEGYKRANSAAGQNFRDLAVMREGARDVFEAQGQARGTLDAIFTVPTVVAFVGHRTDPPGRQPPRFPTSKVRAVREEVRKRLDKIKPVHGLSSLASGADILFVDALLQLGGYARVILPIPKPDFRRTEEGHRLRQLALREGDRSRRLGSQHGRRRDGRNCGRGRAMGDRWIRGRCHRRYEALTCVIRSAEAANGVM